MRKPRINLVSGHTAVRRGTQVARLVLLLGLVLCACTRERVDPLARIRNAGTLRIAVDPAFPPFEFVDGTGTLAGLDVDLGRHIAMRLGVDAHFVTTGYDALYDALTVGRADVIISALYPDPSRMQNFAFTRAYFDAGEVLLVPETSPVEGLSGLAGKHVALVFGTAAHVEALRWEKSLQPPPVLHVEAETDAVIALLAAGRADAAVIDHVSARAALAHAPGLRILVPPVTGEPYTIAGRAEDAALVEAVDEIIEEMQASGELNTLIEQWMR